MTILHLKAHLMCLFGQITRKKRKENSIFKIKNNRMSKVINRQIKCQEGKGERNKTVEKNE